MTTSLGPISSAQAEHHAGLSLPFAVARLASGQAVRRSRKYRVGVMFVRISIDQVASIHDFARMSTVGEIVRKSRIRLRRGRMTRPGPFATAVEIAQ